MRRLIISSLLAALALSVSAAGAFAASAPVITSFSPAQVRVGQVLVINGKNFKRGVLNNRVFFTRASDGKTVRTRPAKVTTRRLQVVVPPGVDKFLSIVDGRKAPTRFQLSVLSGKFSKKTPKSKSPLVLAADAAGAPGPTGQPVGVAPPPPSDCDADGTPDSADNDDDNDLLSDDTELAIHTNACKKDTDGDGVDDVFEYYSALDLNNNALPYPGKRPYPNPLDGSDSGKDFDGDGVTLANEFAAWVAYGNHSLPLSYSDGTQNTGGAAAIPPGGDYMDLNNDGSLSDDEKDVDGDGLPNYVEIAPGGETSIFRETFTPAPPAGTKRATGITFMPGRVVTGGYVYPFMFQLDFVDPDSDGDGVLDGSDDNDHDGLSNVEEISSGADTAYTDPEDPCVPNDASATCRLHPDTNG